ncbi:unnamed protein product [Diamesa serratosioi]
MSTSNSVEIAQSDQELVGSNKKKKQFLVLGGLCLVAVLVVAGIVLAVVLVNDSAAKAEPNVDVRDPLTLIDVLTGRLQPKRFNGTWIDETSYHYFDQNQNFITYDAAQNKKTIVVASTGALTTFTEGSTYEFSADKKYILIARHLIKLFRHSYFALWECYDVEKKIMIPVTIKGQQLAFRLVKFSPVNNSMIIVYENNIYYKKTPVAEEIQITTDGNKDIVNGVPDWVFEEEVLSSNSATWFSPDGKKIAFIRFNDSKVPIMSLPVYGPAGDLAFQYPQSLQVHYPKVGASNPVVHLFVVNLDTITAETPKTMHEIVTPVRLRTDKMDHLITSVSWANDNDLISVWMNRVQNQGSIQKCKVSATTPVCQEARNIDATEGWIEFFTAPSFNKEGTEMTYIASHEDYRHVVALDLTNFKLTPRTSGKFVVTEILASNKENNIILFIANTEEDSKVAHIYAIFNNHGAEMNCLTCDLNENYSHYSAEVSTNGAFMVVTSGGPDIPRSDLYALQIDRNNRNVSLKFEGEVENNEELRNMLEGKKTPKTIFDDIKLDNGSISKVLMVVPNDMDEKKEYPVLVQVYGGPDSSMVTNAWTMDWGSFLTSALDIIYVKIDGRGSGLRGDKNLFALYRQLGTVEVQDQVETMSKLKMKHSYLSKNKTAIWGWSYGGYVSAMSLATDQSNVFQCAISVAPVTDWALYDSIYTERYMGLPDEKDNQVGYANARLSKYAENIGANSKQFMLIHGTLDDNVHFQQGMLLSRVLERHDIQFQEITYPDEDHSLAGVRPHLYHSLNRFVDECFQTGQE